MQPNQDRETLDFVKGIVIDYSSFPIRNLHALSYLPQGIYELAMTVRHKEIREIETWRQISGEPVSVNMPGHYGRLVASLFNWFALSLCNYLRLIALIDMATQKKWDTLQISKNRDAVNKFCAAYTKEVAPEVKLWRDKVAAHPALTDPRQDNLAMLQYSVFDSFSLFNRRFVAGHFRLIVGEHEPPVQPWSLTEVYERLTPRFWPGVELTPFPDWSDNE